MSLFDFGALYRQLIAPSLYFDPGSDDVQAVVTTMGGLHGQYRQADPPGAGNPDDGADPSAGRAQAVRAVAGNNPIYAAARASQAGKSQLTAVQHALMQQMIQQRIQQQAGQMNNLMRGSLSVGLATHSHGLSISGTTGTTVAVPPHAPTELNTTEIVAGELTGWRLWLVSDDGKHLCSLVAGTKWESGKTIEGDPAAGYGVHAFKSKGLIAREYHAAGHSMLDSMMYGEVAMWGDVIEHEDGYRASHAKIASLTCAWLWNSDLEARLRHRYGVGAPSA